jgi:hypothetical protein
LYRNLPADKIHLNKRVVSVDAKAKIVRCGDGTEYPYDTLISTMPLDLLCKQISNVPGYKVPQRPFLLPPSSFLVPPSSFLLPPSSFLVPPSSFLLPPPSSLLPPPSSLLPRPSLLYMLDVCRMEN